MNATLLQIAENVKANLPPEGVTVEYAPGDGGEREAELYGFLTAAGARVTLSRSLDGPRPALRVAHVTFYGVPLGNEVYALAELLVRAGRGLAGGTALSGKVKVSVFVTTDCPFCPLAVIDAAEATAAAGAACEVWVSDDFPEVADAYEVYTVPFTMILNSENGEVYAAAPGYSPERYAAWLRKALAAVKRGAKPPPFP